MKTQDVILSKQSDRRIFGVGHYRWPESLPMASQEILRKAQDDRSKFGNGVESCPMEQACCMNTKHIVILREQSDRRISG